MGMGMCMGFKASLGVNQGTRTSFHEYIFAKSEGEEMERRRVVLFSGGALFNFAKSMHQKEGGKSGGRWEIVGERPNAKTLLSDRDGLMQSDD